jgi:Dolichyl-phosphate-mannose-protein mannosyltransferase
VRLARGAEPICVQPTLNAIFRPESLPDPQNFTDSAAVLAMQTESLQQRSTRSASLLQTAAAVALLLAVTALVRLPGIARPLAGNFATRMTIHGMIARNWASGAAPAWEPTVDCLRDGKPGLHLVEVPLSVYASGALWRISGGSLDVCARLTAIACSVAAVLLLYVLARRWHGARVAFVAALVLALSPVSIVYGQGFMLEPSIVCLTVAARGSGRCGSRRLRRCC